MQGQLFSYSKIAKTVLGKKKVGQVARMKESLGFQPKSEYFLKLNDKKYLNMIMYCLCAKSQMTSGFAKVFKTFEQGYQTEIKDQYLVANDIRTKFHSPTHLEQLSETLTYQRKLLEQCHEKFQECQVQYFVNEFKKQFQVVMKYFGDNNGDYCDALKVEKVEETILLSEDQNSVFIAAFSSKEKLEEEGVRQEKEISEEKKEVDEIPEHLSPNSKKISKGHKKTETSTPDQPSKSNNKKGQKTPKKPKGQKKDVEGEKLIKKRVRLIPLWKKQETWTAIFIILAVITLYVGFNDSSVDNLAKMLFPSPNNEPKIETCIKVLQRIFTFFK